MQPTHAEHLAYHLEVGLRGCGVVDCDFNSALALHFEALRNAPPDNPECCNWNHVRRCGPVPGNPLKDQPGYEPICACGCSGYDERCGETEWWSPAATMDELLSKEN